MNIILSGLATIILSCSTLFFVSAQCDNCQTAAEKADYCFTDTRFANACAQFISGKEYFYLNQKKKPLQVYLPSEKQDLVTYLIKLSENKKMKLSASDILFIQLATEQWKLEERKLGYTFNESGLGIKKIVEGNGEFPQKGQTVEVHYTGYLLDGTKFDSSVDRNQTFKFPLGMGRVIKGWDEGVAALKIGDKAFLYIPSELGYGSRGAGRSIPPDTDLIFEVELLGVE